MTAAGGGGTRGPGDVAGDQLPSQSPREREVAPGPSSTSVSPWPLANRGGPSPEPPPPGRRGETGCRSGLRCLRCGLGGAGDSLEGRPRSRLRRAREGTEPPLANLPGVGSPTSSRGAGVPWGDWGRRLQPPGEQQGEPSPDVWRKFLAAGCATPSGGVGEGRVPLPGSALASAPGGPPLCTRHSGRGI